MGMSGSRRAAGRTGLGGVLRRLGMGFAAVLALSACELLPPQLDAPQAPAVEAPAIEAPAPAPTAPAPRMPPSPPPPRPQFDLQSLIGVGEHEISAMLGVPRQVRNDPPAMVWDYQANGCALRMFFYLDLKSQDFRTLAYNFESGGATDSAKQVCVNRIQDIGRVQRR